MLHFASTAEVEAPAVAASSKAEAAAVAEEARACALPLCPLQPAIAAAEAPEASLLQAAYIFTRAVALLLLLEVADSRAVAAEPPAAADAPEPPAAADAEASFVFPHTVASLLLPVS